MSDRVEGKTENARYIAAAKIAAKTASLPNLRDMKTLLNKGGSGFYLFFKA